MTILNIGGGIGFSGALSKGVIYPDLLYTLSSDNDWQFQALEAKGLPGAWSYQIRGGVGNAHAWGGVLAVPDKALKQYGIAHFTHALANYYGYSGYQGDLSLLSSYLCKELQRQSLSESISLRKLLVTDSTRIKKESLKRMKCLEPQYTSVRSLELNPSSIGVVGDDGEQLGKADEIVLSAGCINTYRILAESGLATKEEFFAEDSFFGRIGRIRFSEKVPAGLFHHHLISKSIRLKTGYEYQGAEGSALFFLQPAIRGIPASDIKLLKEYLALKARPSLSAALRLAANPKLVLELAMMELFMGKGATDFDVYCVLDLGKRRFEFTGKNRMVVELGGARSLLDKAYQSFLEFMAGETRGVETVDHEWGVPILTNLESAYHLCGSVYHEGLVEFDPTMRLWRLKGDERVVINDNSIIAGKGVANPSLGLF